MFRQQIHFQPRTDNFFKQLQESINFLKKDNIYRKEFGLADSEVRQTYNTAYRSDERTIRQIAQNNYCRQIDTIYFKRIFR